MVLSYVGWLSGLTALGVFVFSILFGLYAVFKSRKVNSNLFVYLGLVYICAALVYTGDVLDFFTVLITGTNIDNSSGIIGLMNWVWFPGAVFFAMLFGALLITPDKKWYIIITYLVLGIAFEVFLLLDPSASIEYVNPAVPGEDLINDNLILESIVSIVAMIYLISILIFLGFGFLRKSLQSTGVIKKKFLLLSLGAFLYIAGAVLDGLFSPGISLIFIRSAMVISAWLFYLGLKA